MTQLPLKEMELDVSFVSMKNSSKVDLNAHLHQIVNLTKLSLTIDVLLVHYMKDHKITVLDVVQILAMLTKWFFKMANAKHVLLELLLVQPVGRAKEKLFAMIEK